MIVMVTPNYYKAELQTDVTFQPEDRHEISLHSQLSVMASADLRGELTCCICTDIYTDPVTLTCGHSYCQLCISRTWDNQEQKKPSRTQDNQEQRESSMGWHSQEEKHYSCPECRYSFRVKPALMRNLRLANIVESFRATHSNKKVVGIPCTYCIQSPVLAAKTCLHCEASLCENHLKVHSKSPEHVMIPPTTSLEKRKCPVHKKVLDHYCFTDVSCICASCSLSEKHKGHQVTTLKEAFKIKKGNLGKKLEKLTARKEVIEERVQSLQSHGKEVRENTNGATERVAALFGDIVEKLEALKKQVVGNISRQEKQVSEKISDLIRQLEIKKEDLSRKMGHMEDLCNTTDPIHFLQERESDREDYCDAEEEDDLKVRDAGDLDVGPITAIVRTFLADNVSHLKRELNVGVDTLLDPKRIMDILPDEKIGSGHLLDPSGASGVCLGENTASVTLRDVNTASDMSVDVNTASNGVSVSEDLKTIRWSGINQNRPKNPGRFEYNQVLSSRSFPSGRHYWEVEGSESGEWVVGMCYPSMDRDEYNSLIGYNTKSWGLGRWGNNRYIVRHNSKEIQLPHPPSCWRFGIFLDYEAGRLSFYELCDPIRHLHTFTAAFTEPLHAVLGVSGKNSFLTVS